MEYFEKKRQEILQAIKIERRGLNEKYHTLAHVASMGRSEHLWECRPTDSDFLQLRLGTGSRPFSIAIDYPERRFELEPDVPSDTVTVSDMAASTGGSCAALKR